MAKTILFRLLTLIAISFIIASYFSPIWWVSLKAPNYPPEAFPDGVRIHFHIDGVFNGCQTRQTAEIQEEEPLNCVHEMDTINHYIGMYPIASGGSIERTLSLFLFAFLIALLVTFMVPSPKWQAATLTLAFGGIIVWAYLTLFTPGGVTWMSEGYQKVLESSLEKDRSEFQNWTAFEAMTASYRDTLGMYFRDTQEIEQRVNLLATATYVVIGILLVSMLVFIIGLLWQNHIFYWLLLLIPLFLPAFFILEYAGWLWWFGHNLNEMGAFTIKAFMPTVFGDGKVAQFTTHSYPHYGFGLMMLASLSLGVAGLLRRQ